MKFLSVVAVVWAVSCGQVHTQQPEEETPCQKACDRMAELGCEEAEPDEEGSSCVEVCENVESRGDFSLNPECRAQQDSCEEMESNCNEY